MSDPHASEIGMTRRQAIRVLGAGAALGAVANRFSATVAAQRSPIVRTVLEDIAPARLTGITLFHEHLSMSRSNGAPIFYDDAGLIADEVKACAADGVSCIVDAGVAGL